MSRTVPILVSDGGLLRTQKSISLENIGPANFSRLLNLRRVKDQLVRREGWATFVPVAGSAAPQYTFDGVETMLRIAELRRGDGTRVIVAASKTLIKRFDTATGTWVQIGSGFSMSGVPWQAVTLSSVLILNNAVNLPVTYEVGDAAVAPLYEAREQGIASCGRIAEYNGFLFLGDVVEIRADQLTPWMNGYTSYTTTSTSPKATNFTVAMPGDHRTQFEVTTGASNVLATLPSPLPIDSRYLYFWIKKVDAGSGIVTTTPLIADQEVILDSINDTAFITWDGFKWVATLFPSGVIPSTDPYGITPTSIQQAIPDEQAWSDFGNPKNFSPLLLAIKGGANTTIALPFPVYSWQANKTRVGVINAGVGGGILGGQSAYPEGVLITAIAPFSPGVGVVITLEVTTDINLTYPRQIGVTRWTDTSTSAGKQRLGNGQRITAMFPLNGVQIVAHEHGFFINRYTSVATAPFALREKYQGDNVPMSGDCIAGYNTEFVIYPTPSRNFYKFDGTSDPEIHKMLDDAKDYFFAGLTNTDRIWAVNNTATNEIWFVRPSYVLTFGYNEDSFGPAEMDAQIDAACGVIRPGSNVNWFMLGIANLAMYYGLIQGAATTWFRNGVAAYPKYVSGLQSFGADQIREKNILSYTPLLSSPSPDVEITVQIRMTHSANAPLVDKLVPVETLPSPVNGNYIPLDFQEVYAQEEVNVTDARDIDFRISGRTWEVDSRVAAGITRRIGI